MSSTQEAPGPGGNEREPVAPINVDDLMEKFDREARYLRITGLWATVVKIIAIGFSLFQLYTALFGVLEAQIQRPTHLMFALALIYLLYPTSGKSKIQVKVHPFDLSLAILSCGLGLYSILNYETLMESAGIYSDVDFIMGILGIVLTLEATRRIVGLPIVIIAVGFLLYAYLGPYFPGFLGHRGYGLKRMVTHMWFTTEGIMGIPLGVSATFIFLFILFGSFLTSTGIMDFFMDIANAVAGWASGGPAKVAVIASAFEGTVSGSSVANTVGSGSFTIPMMKRLGYRPEFAGAVEAAASTGGQIMPPVMGAAAFLMAEFINMPYVEIAKAAAIPALLYFTGVWVVVHFEAKKYGLKGLPREQLPKLMKIAKERSYLILPLIGIIYFLVEGSTPMRAALAGLGLCIAVGMVRKTTRLNLSKFLETLESGARGALGVAAACATAGIIVGVVTLTGLGLKMGDGLIALAGGMLILTLAFTMITSLILGMGAPTTANYVITSTIAAPALIKLGVPILAAHMFAFYFGIIADLTPPVALAAFAGAAIARANPFKTGVIATKLAIAAFLVPYIFVYNPSLLLIKATPIEIAQMILTAIIGMIGLGAAVEGWYWTHMSWWERIASFASGLLLIDPGTLTDIIGVCILGLITAIQYRKWRAARSLPRVKGASKESLAVDP
ncbi:MAG TPA: TRAP transporter permease [Thermodesulfobacteriota bacterium]|nr:TRAP transporter permease [Thermodesulfobacteriota bacterium]